VALALVRYRIASALRGFIIMATENNAFISGHGIFLFRKCPVMEGCSHFTARRSLCFVFRCWLSSSVYFGVSDFGRRIDLLSKSKEVGTRSQRGETESNSNEGREWKAVRHC
jgi:hypothetical protein